MNGIKRVKGETFVTCAVCQRRCDETDNADKPCEPETCEAESLVQYGGYYMGFSDLATGWEGTVCIQLAASLAAHNRFMGGRNVEERPGRISMILQALGNMECDEASEMFVKLAAKAGTKPPIVKIVNRKCHREGLHYLVFLLPKEKAPGDTWFPGKS